MTPSKSVLTRVLALCALMLSVTASPALAGGVVSRAAGPDRVQTAVEASQDFRATSDDVVLSTAVSFPDALAAAALTHRLDAPLLLTSPDGLSAVVEEELSRLQAQTVWILGGENAVSSTIQDRLASLGYGTRRLAGATRYETAREIAVAAGPSRTGEVVLALGEHTNPNRAWPDAVASGALAATPDRVPTLLTRPDALPAATEEALQSLDAKKIIILGGDAVVSAAVENRLVDLGYATRRVVEGSRYDTSAALAQDALSRFDASTSRPAVFASGRAFPDALAAGSLAASLGAPLLLVPPSDTLPNSSEQFLRGNAGILDSGVIVGGPVSADDYVLAQLDAALRNAPAPAVPTDPAEDGEDQSEGQEAQEAEAPNVAAASDDEDPDDETSDDETSDEEVLETFEGKASWYGPGLEGNQTANGETFDPSQLTAAHRSLPFDTMLRVTNLDNDRVVTVRINDRGPFHSNRVLDLSSGAADELQMKGDGVATIRGEVLSYGEE